MLSMSKKSYERAKSLVHEINQYLIFLIVFTSFFEISAIVYNNVMLDLVTWFTQLRQWSCDPY